MIKVPVCVDVPFIQHVRFWISRELFHLARKWYDREKESLVVGYDRHSARQ